MLRRLIILTIRHTLFLLRCLQTCEPRSGRAWLQFFPLIGLRSPAAASKTTAPRRMPRVSVPLPLPVPAPTPQLPSSCHPAATHRPCHATPNGTLMLVSTPKNDYITAHLSEAHRPYILSVHTPKPQSHHRHHHHHHHYHHHHHILTTTDTCPYFRYFLYLLSTKPVVDRHY